MHIIILIILFDSILLFTIRPNKRKNKDLCKRKAVVTIKIIELKYFFLRIKGYNKR